MHLAPFEQSALAAAKTSRNSLNVDVAIDESCAAGSSADDIARPNSANKWPNIILTDTSVRWRELAEGYPWRDILRFVPGSDYAVDAITHTCYASKGEYVPFRWEEVEVWFEVYQLWNLDGVAIEGLVESRPPGHIQGPDGAGH